MPTTDPDRAEPLATALELLRRLDDEIVQVYVDAGIPDFRSRFTMPLVRLSRLGPLSIKALAAECEVTHSAMSQTVTAMRRAGLVESVADPADGRARLVELTDHAQRIVALGEAEWAATEAVLEELESETPYPMSQVVARPRGRSRAARVHRAAACAPGGRLMRGALIDLRPRRRHRSSRRLWFGTSLSLVGGQLTVFAVMLQVWQLTHSPVWTGSIGLAHAVPTLVLSPLGGALADRVDRRTLVLVTAVGQLAAVVALALQAALGAESVWLVLGLVGVQTSFAALGSPARRTFVPRLLPACWSPAGLALTHISFQAAMLLGPTIAGLVTAAWGLQVCYAVDAATFLAAMYASSGCLRCRPHRTPTSARPRAARSPTACASWSAGPSCAAPSRPTCSPPCSRCRSRCSRWSTRSASAARRAPWDCS